MQLRYFKFCPPPVDNSMCGLWLSLLVRSSAMFSIKCAGAKGFIV